MGNTIFDKQVVALGIEQNIGNLPLYTLAKEQVVTETAGTISVAVVDYIGDAEKVDAGKAIPETDFSTSVEEVKISKVARNLKFPEEEIQSSYFDLGKTSEEQLIKALGNGIENAFVANLQGITGVMLHESEELTITVDVIADALVKMGENIADDKVLVVSPVLLNQLRKDADFTYVKTDEGKFKSVGNVFGCEVVVSNKVPNDEFYILTPNALAIYINRDITVESAKDITNQTTNVVGTVYFGTTIANKHGAVRVTLSDI